MAPELHRELLKQVGESLTSGDTTECRGSGGDEPKGLQTIGRPQYDNFNEKRIKLILIIMTS